MATNTRNVIVGAANLFVSNKNGASRPVTTPSYISTNIVAAGSSATAQLNAGTDFRQVGYTSTGLEVSYEPVYGEVMVDQLLDAARLFKQTLKVMLKSELAEGTLENLNISWGQSDFVQTAAGSTVYTLNNTSSSTASLNLIAGAVGDTPVERTIVFVSSAPRQIGSQYDPSQNSGAGGSTGLPHTSDLKQKERVYIARRVVQIDTTMHALKRDAATVFPVNFRCLPDDADPSYSGAEYGVVIDRVYGTV
jgi:hypothetical protein